MKIGFIGQGFIGGAYADDFEARGYECVRYALEEPYCNNKEEIASCDIVFIAVPTPTTPEGFDGGVVSSVLSLVGDDKIAVIKSTVVPGATKKFQDENPAKIVLHSPEFLRERTAKDDAKNPERNIIGMPVDSKRFQDAAEKVHTVLPDATFTLTCLSDESEFIKYIGNGFLYTKVVFANLMYDLAQKLGVDWDTIKQGVTADSRIAESHFDPVHKSGHSDTLGRGAGGHCFIKDFATLTLLFDEMVGDSLGTEVLKSLETKNNSYLRESGKDLDLLAGVYRKTKV